MAKGTSWKTILVLTAAFFAASLAFSSTASAASSILRGKAWWNDQLQYVYFNCLDDVVGDSLDSAYNLCGGDGTKSEAECVPPNYAFHFFSVGCSWLQHAVQIDENGKLSGSAWNYAKGLISFEATTTPNAVVPDRSMLSGPCPVCYSDSNCWACYNEAQQRLYGWGRSTVDGTWIRLDSGATPYAQIKNWNASSSTVPFYNLQPGDFIGSGSSTLGDLSLNCQSENSGAGNCGERDYKVYIGNLQVGYMSAPNWSYSEACSSGARKAVLRWYLKSGSQPMAGLGQSAYRVIVNTSNSTSSPVFDSGKIAGSASQLICPGPTCPWTPNYNTSYYWWLQLWDQDDLATEWYQYKYNSASDSDGNSDGNVQTFTTYKHEFPSPFFVWEPYDVSERVGTTTDFMSYNATTSSVYYTTAQPSLPQSCGTPTCQYLWSVQNNDGTIIASPTGATTSIIFAHPASDTTVSLRITDSDGYYCTAVSEPLEINYGLPIWREVKAQ